MSSTFNPDLFMQSQVNESNSTKVNPFPEGEFAAYIKNVAARTTSNGSALIDVTWGSDDQQAKDETGMNEPTVRQSIFLDLTEAGGLDFGKGKNVSLGRLREALNQNASGKPWSPSMLLGQPARIKVTHSVDKNDSSITYANVTAVTKL